MLSNSAYVSGSALVTLSSIGVSLNRYLRQKFAQLSSLSTAGPALVDGEWLEPRLGKGVKVFDATWFLTAAHGQRNADAEFTERRIPTALRFDLDRLADPAEKDLPHMLPPVDWFGLRMDELGVSPQDPIVVYDTLGQFSAARAFWTLNVLGGHNVKLLDGGLPRWVKENRRLESGPRETPKPNAPGTWKNLAKPKLDLVVKVGQVEEIARKAVATQKVDTQIIDARPKGRFTGADPEPRAGLKKGRIPGSLNVPFKDVLNEDGTFKNSEALRKVFEGAGVDFSKPVVTSCGSGTTAAVLSFALQEVLGVKAPLYDGSFAEWGKVSANRPVL